MTAIAETTEQPTKKAKLALKAPAKPAKSALVLAGDPTVQLLPPAVRDRAKAREFRRLMVLLVILSVVIVAAGVAVGLVRTISAQTALDEAHAETARIMAEQQTYREGAAIADLVEATKQAQTLVTSTEVDWNHLYSDIKKQLGSKVDITQLNFTTSLPWSSVPESPGVLRPAPVVTATVTLASSSVLNLADVTDRFTSLPGFLEVYFDSTSQTGEDGTYLTTVTIAFDEERFLGRYAPADAAGGDPASDDEPVADDAAAEEDAQ